MVISQDNEIWKPLTEYNGKLLKPYYQVSNKGRIKAIEHATPTMWRDKLIDRHFPERLFTANKSNSGYLQVILNYPDGSNANVAVHRAVASTFCENLEPKSKTFVNHKDGDKENNCSENLEWVTPKENTQHAIDSGLIVSNILTRCPVKRIETGEIFDSLSSASRAMGRWYGYLTERLKQNKKCTDIYGNEWTFEIRHDLIENTCSEYRKRVNAAISNSKQI